METYAIGMGTLVSFLLLTARVMAVLQFTPPFNAGAIPIRVRLAIAAGTGIALAPVLPTAVDPTTSALALAIAYQIVVGAAMGSIIAFFMAALQAAGSMIDVVSGIGVAVLYDPTTQVQAGPVGRLHQLVMVTVLFVIDGHLLIMRGVLRTFEVAPLGGFNLDLIPDVFLRAATDLMLAAAEIALPVLVALSMTEAVMALATRAAPKLNVMVLGFAAKALVMILVLTISMPLAVRSVSVLIERSVTFAVRVVSG